MICYYFIHKTDWADLSVLKNSRQILIYLLPLESGNLQLEQTKFPVFSPWFGKISKFPVFSLTRNYFLTFFPVFPVFPVQWVPLSYEEVIISLALYIILAKSEVQGKYPVYDL